MNYCEIVQAKRLGLFCRFDGVQQQFISVHDENSLLCVLRLTKPKPAAAFPQAYKRVPKGERDMKAFIKDLILIVLMMAGLIGAAAFCLFAPPIPLWVSLPIIAVCLVWLLKEIYRCR